MSSISYFTENGMPDGPVDNKKWMYGCLALVGVVMMIAASILGLGIPLVILAIPASIKLASIITLGGVGFTLTASMIHKLYREKIIAQVEQGNDESPHLSGKHPEILIEAEEKEKSNYSRLIVSKNKMEKIIKPKVTNEQLKNFKKIFKSDAFYYFYEGHDYLDKNVEVLCQALLISNSLNKQGIPVFFTAQQMDAIFFQVIMKKIHEGLKGDLGKHRKIIRTDLSGIVSNINDIHEKRDYTKQYESLICASCNIFHQDHGESVNFFLYGGKTQSGFSLGRFLPKEIQAYCEVNQNQLDNFVLKLTGIFNNYKNKLPERALEILVLDVDDPSNYVRLSGRWGAEFSLPLPPEQNLKQYLICKNQQLTNFTDMPSVRIIAPRPNLEGIRVLRMLNEKDKTVFNSAKREIQELVNEFLKNL